MRTSAHSEPTPMALALTLGAVILLYGMTPPITKLISAPAVPAMAVRFWMAAPVLCVVAKLSGHELSRALLRRTAAPGLLFGLNLPLVFLALQHTSVAVVSVMLSLQPCVVMIIASQWMDEPITRWHAAWVGVGVAGAGVVVAGSSAALRSDALGVLLAVGAMLTFTGYYLMNRSARSTTPIAPIQWMAGVTCIAAITSIPIAVATSDATDFRMIGGADWVYLAFVAIGSGVIAHASMSWVHKYVGASRSSLVLLLVNVVAVFAAWPINGERISLVQIVGGVVVAGAILAVMSRPPVPVPSPSPAV